VCVSVAYKCGMDTHGWVSVVTIIVLSFTFSSFSRELGLDAIVCMVEILSAWLSLRPEGRTLKVRPQRNL